MFSLEASNARRTMSISLSFKRLSAKSDVNFDAYSPIHNGERKVVKNDAKGLIYEYATGEQYATLINGASTTSDLEIDDKVPGTSKKVTAIAAQAFIISKNLATLVIPEGVETIGAGAFKGCSVLKTLTLPSTLQEIGEEAFADSKSLSVIYCGIP